LFLRHNRSLCTNNNDEPVLSEPLHGLVARVLESHGGLEHILDGRLQLGRVVLRECLESQVQLVVRFECRCEEAVAAGCGQTIDSCVDILCKVVAGGHDVWFGPDPAPVLLYRWLLGSVLHRRRLLFFRHGNNRE
jgi:hypothetical protein